MVILGHTLIWDTSTFTALGRQKMPFVPVYMASSTYHRACHRRDTGQTKLGGPHCRLHGPLLCRRQSTAWTRMC
jgi:hypothetical protein